MKLLEKLITRVSYMDTDIAFYIETKRKEELTPRSGDYLGDLTDVLEDENCVISRFCSGGLKNYGYDIFSEENNENNENSL